MSNLRISSSSRLLWIFCGLGAFAIFLLFTEHRTHMLSILFYVAVLMCPLMHFFMHKGHKHE